MRNEPVHPPGTQNCMAMVEQSQVWVGSEDSIIYIISVHSMSCNKQLADHRASVTGLVVPDGTEAPRYAGLRGGVTCGARQGEGSESGCEVLSLSISGLGDGSTSPAGTLGPFRWLPQEPPCSRVPGLASVLGQAQVRWT